AGHPVAVNPGSRKANWFLRLDHSRNRLGNRFSCRGKGRGDLDLSLPAEIDSVYWVETYSDLGSSIMRVILKEYASGGHLIVETADDGSVLLSEWEGQRKIGERICAYVEVACDNTPEGVERLLEALAMLGEEIKKRKLQPVPTS